MVYFYTGGFRRILFRFMRFYLIFLLNLSSFERGVIRGVKTFCRKKLIDLQILESGFTDLSLRSTIKKPRNQSL
jgi:hypothetical protein